jgi:dephospho-CoA kinase
MATRFVGLTGGIGSGKSTVAAMFRELGAGVVDADALAREVVEPGEPALADIVRRFGPGVLTPEGRLDRPKLAAIVFGDSAARAALNAITHPRIALLAAKRSQALAEAGTPVVLYEAALLIENGLHHALEGVVLVVVPPEMQVLRLVTRDGFTPEEARARLAAQLPLEEKLKVATYLIDNSGTLAETRAQVERVYAALLQESAP